MWVRCLVAQFPVSDAYVLPERHAVTELPSDAAVLGIIISAILDFLSVSS